MAPIRAHHVFSALLKRLADRNPDVQLYALSVAEALSKHCPIAVHREITSLVFVQCLEKIITDRVCPFY
jgi:signal transducing adaptor molecule